MAAHLRDLFGNDTLHSRAVTKGTILHETSKSTDMKKPPNEIGGYIFKWRSGEDSNLRCSCPH